MVFQLELDLMVDIRCIDVVLTWLPAVLPLQAVVPEGEPCTLTRALRWNGYWRHLLIEILAANVVSAPLGEDRTFELLSSELPFVGFCTSPGS